MDTSKGKWDGHFYVPYEKMMMTACGIKTSSKIEIAGTCTACAAMLTNTMGWTEGGEPLWEGWYSNSNGFAVVVVAVINPCVDWTAYIGGCNLTEHEEAAVRWTVRHGVKLPYRHARTFFPNLPEGIYRP